MSEIRIKNPVLPRTFIRPEDLATLRSISLPLLLLAGSLSLWIFSLPKIDPGKMSDLGLVSVLPVTFFLALAVITISFLMLLHWNECNEFILVMHIIALILIVHGTPQIVYGTLRYSWAWKHVGIVDYIQRHGSVDPLINNLNAYHNWPGFFALSAFFNQISGLQSSLTYAGWGPVFFNVLNLFALLMIYKALTIDRRLVWLSIWFFYLFSWVGQDYFSPQAFTYFLYLVTFAVLLRWFRVNKINFWRQTQTFLHSRWIPNLYRNIVQRSVQDNEQVVRTNAYQRTSIMITLILIFFVVASSHQLTPLMIVSGLTLLVVFQIINQRFLPLLMAVATIVWVIFMAVGFLNGNLSWVVRSFGSFFQNINGNLLNLTIASPGQQLIAKMDRGLSVSVWILGLIGFYRRYKKGHWDLIAVLLSVAPLPLLVLNGYGGEMLFRVYLFALPFITFLAAGLFYANLKDGTSYKTPLFAALTSFVLLPGFLFGYYGKEKMYYFSPKEVAAAQFVYDTAPKGSLIIDGTWDWPRQAKNYEYYDYLSVAGYSEAYVSKLTQNPVEEFSKLIDQAVPESEETKLNQPDSQASGRPSVYPAAYLVITRSQIAEAEMTGILPPDWLSNLPKILSQSEKFKIIYSNSDAVVIEYLNVNSG